MHKKLLFAILTFILAASPFLTACSPTTQTTEAPAVATEVPSEPTAASEPTEAPAPIELTDGLGRDMTIESPAQRIVSLAPSNTELLFAIGADTQVMARDTFSDFPPQALDLPDIGGGFGELDTETILSLEPDLVLVADITPAEQVQSLEELGLVVFALPNPNIIKELYDNLGVVGQLTGQEANAEAVADELRLRVAAVEEQVATVETPPLVFYQLDSTDPNAPWTAGLGNFIDTLITMAGGVNLGSSLDSPWVQISVEELITQNPDVIFIGDFTWGGVTAADVIARPGWDVIAAVQNAQVFEFDDNLASRPGPRLVDGLEAMAALLHPKLFK